MLTAFSEGTLLPRERESVLAHAAACGDCRRVMNLAAGAAAVEASMPPVPITARKWSFGRIWIPSFAAAAAVAVIAIVVIQKAPDKKGAPQNVAANVPATISPAAAPGAGNSQSVATQAKNAANLHAKNQSDEQTQTSPPAGATPENSKLETAAVAPVEAKRVQPAAPASAFSNTLTSKALATAPASSIARPRWRINGLGQPERAFGNGPWEQVLPNESPKMRVLSVYAGQVWVGGEKSAVMRSFDNGATWRVVRLPEKNGNDHAIAHIRFENAENLNIEAVDGTVWSSSDGGETWN